MTIPGALRTGAPWLLAIPFFALATPSARAMSVGGIVAAAGLALRAWAAGTIVKDRALSVSGPYAHTRNPLYLGSFLIGVGLTIAGGHWLWPLLFIATFTLLYIPTMRREAHTLAERFGSRYGAYAEAVPGFLPRATPARVDGDRPGAHAFSWSRYFGYREWEALLGAGAGFAVLAVRLSLSG